MARDFPYVPLSTETGEAVVSAQVKKLSAWVDDYFNGTWGFFWKESRLTWAKAQVSDWGKVNEAAMINSTEHPTEAIFLEAFRQKVAEDESRTGIAGFFYGIWHSREIAKRRRFYHVLQLKAAIENYENTMRTKQENTSPKKANVNENLEEDLLPEKDNGTAIEDAQARVHSDEWPLKTRVMRWFTTWKNVFPTFFENNPVDELLPVMEKCLSHIL